jgi:ABC-2 type transport system ATP-binding protein
MYKKAISIYKLDDKNKFKDFEIKEETDSFITYFVKNQNLNKFFDILSSCTYEDIEIKRPSLEEIFIDYYRSDEE